MPLASTNVWAFRQARPTYDGRGVLIGILDSGIDGAVLGLGVTSTGDPKLLDLRDFSGEGRVALAPLALRGDTATLGGSVLAGLGRLVAVGGSGPFFAGVIAERPLGELPASDLNGDGDNGDQLPIVVAKASDGWVLVADTDGDGSLANERPVHDFLVARETFGWTSRGQPSPIAIAANFAEENGAPTLDLFFDTSGHGTHVAGIAAGADLYGVKGFDGVAPGAQLLGLKIANNAYGGISVTGSMLRAMDYAIRFARERRLPLVLNMSFGVGNEREGAARIDAIVDSVLAVNPEVVFTTSAGNDGPGLSTIGFPGSAERVISVGATIPPAFVGAAPGAADAVAFFSSRGGEVAKPDILAPGIAYSSVPRWETGSEDKSGTSMAAPHVAGAVALLLSGFKQEKRGWAAGQIRQAILASGRGIEATGGADQGAGLLDLVAADRIARRLPAMAVVRVKAGGVPGGAVLDLVAPGSAADSTVVLTVEGTLGGPIRLVSSAAWLTAPASVQLTPPSTSFAVSVNRATVPGPGLVAASLTAWATDTAIGPLFRVPVTLVKPFPVSDTGVVIRSKLDPGGVQRVFFAADSARPFRVSISTTAQTEEMLAFLHEPGGQPFRVENGRRAAFGEEAAEYDVDGRDVQPGLYEAIAAAPPNAGGGLTIRVDRSPVRLDASRVAKDTIAALVTNGSETAQTGAAVFGLIGAERGMVFSQRGSAERRIVVRVPPWAKRVVTDLQLPKATWPLFTDLGLTLLDQDGQVLEAAPLNYAFGRLTRELDSTHVEKDLVIVVAPAFADPGSSLLWDGTLSIRFYAEAPVLIEPAGSAEFALSPGAAQTIRYPMVRIPWTLGDGFFPLGALFVDVGGVLWGREARLPEPTPPLMR
jgi:subtilisin family serine protease